MNKRLMIFMASALTCLCLASIIFGQTPGSSQGKRLPFMTGAVSGLDTTASTLTISMQLDGSSQIIKISPNTQIAAEIEQQVSDLKIGDQIQVTGIPTGITVSQMIVGQTSDQLSSLFASSHGKPGQTSNEPKPQSPALAMATGRVFATDPLIIAVTDDEFVTLKLAQNAKIVKVNTLSLAGIHLGDHIFASGQFAADGSFTANAVAINGDHG